MFFGGRVVCWSLLFVLFVLFCNVGLFVFVCFLLFGFGVCCWVVTVVLVVFQQDAAAVVVCTVCGGGGSGGLGVWSRVTNHDYC